MRAMKVLSLALSSLALALVVGGCATETPDTADRPERGSIGKADQWGTCAPADCGGPASVGWCYCDELCHDYDDCCSNKVDTCGGGDEPVIVCGGFAGLPCPAGLVCVDDPSDDCDVASGGADCGGMCVEPTCPSGAEICDAICAGSPIDVPPACPTPSCACPSAPNSCEGQCGGPSADGSCWCDDLCTSYGDCCEDETDHC